MNRLPEAAPAGSGRRPAFPGAEALLLDEFGDGRRCGMAFKTEYEFELPRGYIDENGNLHRRGTMRLATAADEILPMRDQRVQQNPAYLTIILLARVITKLGDLRAVDTKVIERLFTVDLAYLQQFYREINETEKLKVRVVCPKCDHEHEVDVSFLSLTEGE
jgi:phage FluMu protein gp41